MNYTNYEIIHNKIHVCTLHSHCYLTDLMYSYAFSLSLQASREVEAEAEGGAEAELRNNKLLQKRTLHYLILSFK